MTNKLTTKCNIGTWLWDLKPGDVFVYMERSAADLNVYIVCDGRGHRIVNLRTGILYTDMSNKLIEPVNEVTITKDC